MWKDSKSVVGLEVPHEIGHPPKVYIVEASKVFGDTWVAKSLSSKRNYPTKIIPDRLNASMADRLAVLVGEPLGLGEYLRNELIRCLHGDEDSGLLAALRHSSLPGLEVRVQAK